MLVDTGPDECYPALRARLEKLPRDRAGRRRIDVFVVTHIDHDHIGGAAQLLADKSLGLTFGDVWFNAPSTRARGVKEGQGLADLLGLAERKLPWNRAFGGGLISTGQVGSVYPLPRRRGWPLLTVLSPTDDALQALFKVWDRELAKLAEPTRPRSALLPASRGVLDVEALAATASRRDTAVANASSIALLLEHRGHSILLAGDAVPHILEPAVKTLVADASDLLNIDVFKLSHHGSRGNVTRSLLRTVNAAHYVVSTNGAIFGHPDDEAIARVLVDGGRGKTVWFNHPAVRHRRWAAAALRQQYGHEVVMSKNAAAGVTLNFGGQP